VRPEDAWLGPLKRPAWVAGHNGPGGDNNQPEQSMRPVTLPPAPASTDAEARWRWLVAALGEIERASQNDPAQILDSYSVTGTATTTRSINVLSPTPSNTAQVLATLIADFQARGVNRTQPT